MGAFAYTVAAGGTAATYGIRWLLVSALSGLSAADWIGESSVTIAGFDMPITQSTTPAGFTTLGPDGSTGVVVDPSGTNVNFWFTPSVSALASHYSITTTVHDQWLLMLSWTSLTNLGANGVMRVRMDNSDDSRGWMCDYIQNGGLKFRVNNYATFTDTAVAGVESLGLLSNGRALFGDYRYKTSETLDWSAMTAAGFAENNTSAMAGSGGTAPATSASAESAAVTLTDFQIGTNLKLATDAVTITGMAIGWIPGPGDSQA